MALHSRPSLRAYCVRLRLLLSLALASSSTTHAAPLKPDFTLCGDYYETTINCCKLPDLMHPTGPKDYIEWHQYLRENPLPKRPRLRRAAHLPEAAFNTTYLEQLNRAYQLIRSLPSDDFRSLYNQNYFHCMYGGTGVEKQLGFPHLEFSIHVNWLFLPWHRWFTFFFERILAKLVGDDDFALPFWNWDNQARLHPILPNILPHFYRNPDKYPALYHGARDPRHLPGRPAVIADLLANPLYYPNRVQPDDPDQLRDENNAHLHRFTLGLTRNTSDQGYFLSMPMRLGDDPVSGGLTFEAQVHGTIHFWLSDEARNWEDMGVGYGAVRDPIFFAHHANVDRMWGVWEAMGRQNFNASDFLDAEFFFYNEHAQLVRVTVADCLDQQKLMYAYQEVENPWTTYDPQATIDSTSSRHSVRRVATSR